LEAEVGTNDRTQSVEAEIKRLAAVVFSAETEFVEHDKLAKLALTRRDEAKTKMMSHISDLLTSLGVPTVGQLSH
jgi:hypothetical protein